MHGGFARCWLACGLAFAPPRPVDAVRSLDWKPNFTSFYASISKTESQKKVFRLTGQAALVTGSFFSLHSGVKTFVSKFRDLDEPDCFNAVIAGSIAAVPYARSAAFRRNIVYVGMLVAVDTYHEVFDSD